MPRTAWRVGFGLSLILNTGLMTGCATRGPVPSPPPPADRAPRVSLPSEDLWKLYEQAVETTREPKASAISTGLVPIVHWTPGLRWDGEGRVLMATWTKREFYESSVGKLYTFTHGAVWLTAVPFAQDFCRGLGLPPDQLRLRLNQLLGLPPDGDDDAFVQMWVDPKDFFRPCADPEITDRECTLNLTTHEAPEGQCPWTASFAGQISVRWVSVTQEHLDWMCGNWSKSFPPDPRKGYPWTGLGYTYDWGRPSPIGQSEFVAPQGTTVLIESVTGTEEYCQAQASRTSTRTSGSPWTSTATSACSRSGARTPMR